ncbi:REP-associated tyrosine transposase [Marinobacterium rhizophilum]|nr:transposase [Marinobacterium rhizophilum]
MTGMIYLVTTVTWQREPLLREFDIARIVTQTINRAPPTTLAYVVMPDHVHWLLQLQSDTTLALALQRVKSISAHQINQHLSRRGPVWQRGYHDHAVRNEEDLRQLARYVVANPVRAGIVTTVKDYPHWDAIWL